jgi:hypothetical protein
MTIANTIPVFNTKMEQKLFLIYRKLLQQSNVGTFMYIHANVKIC